MQEQAPDVTALEGFVVLHLLLMTYWLGTDLAVFYVSRFVLQPDLATPTRAVAVRVMSVLDLAPRICLVLFLPSGVSLMAYFPLGEDLFGGWRLAAVWVLSLAWLGLVLFDFRFAGHRLHDPVRRLDLAVRYVLVVALGSIATYTIVADRPFGVDSDPRWLGAKVLVYALAIACGIAIRHQLRPFGPAFGELLTSGSSPAVERVLQSSVRRSIPFVAVIWACVLAAAVLGVAQPGADL